MATTTFGVGARHSASSRSKVASSAPSASSPPPVLNACHSGSSLPLPCYRCDDTTRCGRPATMRSQWAGPSPGASERRSRCRDMTMTLWSAWRLRAPRRDGRCRSEGLEMKDEVLGRSNGGLTSKIHLGVDGVSCRWRSCRPRDGPKTTPNCYPARPDPRLSMTPAQRALANSALAAPRLVPSDGT